MLIVDDDERQRETLRELVEALGCRVDVTVDGLAAVRAVESARPDLVLMDLGLKDVDGWEATRMIRERRRLAGDDYRPYIVVHSGFTDADSRRAAFAAGCDEYIVKPLDVTGALRVCARRRGRRIPGDTD